MGSNDYQTQSIRNNNFELVVPLNQKQKN